MPGHVSEVLYYDGKRYCKAGHKNGRFCLSGQCDAVRKLWHGGRTISEWHSENEDEMLCRTTAHAGVCDPVYIDDLRNEVNEKIYQENAF